MVPASELSFSYICLVSANMFGLRVFDIRVIHFGDQLPVKTSGFVLQALEITVGFILGC